MNDTPRTEKAAFHAKNWPGKLVGLEFARQLERENSALREQLSQHRCPHIVSSDEGTNSCDLAGQCADDLIEAKKQLAEKDAALAVLTETARIGSGFGNVTGKGDKTRCACDTCLALRPTYACNKCGYVGEQGPMHAGCNYSAVDCSSIPESAKQVARVIEAAEEHKSAHETAATHPAAILDTLNCKLCQAVRGGKV